MVDKSAVPMEGYEYLLVDSWQSLRHDDHKLLRIAHYEYYTRWAPRDAEGSISGDLHGDPKIARKQVYMRLEDKGWRRKRHNADFQSSLTTRLRSWGIHTDAQVLATKIAKAVFKYSTVSSLSLCCSSSLAMVPCPLYGQTSHFCSSRSARQQGS